jgi:hypothetical protein
MHTEYAKYLEARKISSNSLTGSDGPEGFVPRSFARSLFVPRSCNKRCIRFKFLSLHIDFTDYSTFLFLSFYSTF